MADSDIIANARENPGSKAALDAGCTCAVLDNNHGRFPVYVDDLGNESWWITSDCPLHGPGSGWAMNPADRSPVPATTEEASREG